MRNKDMTSNPTSHLISAKNAHERRRQRSIEGSP
jgi:hypothetical protein